MNEEPNITIALEKKDETKKNGLIFNKIINWCLYIFIALMPLWFLPFTVNVLELNKQVLMISLLTIALIAWLGKLLSQEKVEWYRGLVIPFFLVFVVIYGLATFFSIRPYDSLMGLDTHLSRSMINVIYFFIFFLLLVNHKQGRVHIFKFLFILLISSAIAGVIGLLQIWGKFIFPWDFTKANSFNTIGTVFGLGIFLAVLLPLALAWLLKKSSSGDRARRIFLAIFIVIALVTIFLLNFRIIWIIAAAGMVIVLGFWLSKRHHLSTQAPGWLAIPVLILAFCLIFLLFRPGLTFNLNLPIEVGLSYRAGIDIVKEIIQRNPILGTGPETFVYNYSLHKPENVNQTIFWNLRFVNAPAEILSLLSEIGILGLLAFIALIGIFSFKIIKSLVKENLGQMTEVKIGLFASWLSLLVAWFLYPQNILLMFAFWLFFALLVIVSRKKEDIITINLRASNRVASIVGFGFIILIIAIIGLLYLGGSKFIAEAKYKTGLGLLNKGELDSSINKVIRATIINPYEDKFYRNLAQLFLVQINQNLNNPDPNPQEQARKIQVGISNTINSAVRATTLNPQDVNNWITRGLVYRNLMAIVSGAGDWAVQSYEEALKLEPNNPFIHTEIGRTYINGANLVAPQAQKNEEARKQLVAYLNKALEAYNKAIEAKPNYALAHFETAVIYDRLGQAEQAITRMEAARISAPRDIGIAFQLGVLYYKDSQFDKAAREFARAIAVDPNFSNARYFLGLLLDRAGYKEAAIEQFEKIAELNPDSELVKQILVNLRAGKPALGEGLGPPEQPEEIPIEEKQPEESPLRLPSK